MIDQGTPEWFDQRRGKVTASRIADVMAKLKSGQPAATRKNYAAQLVAERLTGETQDSFQSNDMTWGIETEAEARAAYELKTGNRVELVGFVDHPTIPMTGASPDGRVGEKGAVEIKCPKTATHIEMLLTEKIDAKYINQMQWQMECDDRKWCDFVSYDPRLPWAMRLFIKRVLRDNDALTDIRAEVAKFLGEAEETVTALRNKYEKDGNT